MRIILRVITVTVVTLSILLSACSGNPPVSPAGSPEAQETPTPPAPGAATSTPFLPDEPAALPSPTPEPDLSVWVDPSLPTAFVERLAAPAGIHQVDQVEDAAFSIRVYQESGQENTPLASVDWIYALVAPFPTVLDGVSGDELRQAWQGAGSGPFDGKTILLDAQTLVVLQTALGPADPSRVKVVPADKLVDEAWVEKTSWAIVPFEGIEPRWKVLTVDGVSPIRKEFAAGGYPLRAKIGLFGPAEWMDQFSAKWTGGSGAFALPVSNRDPSKMTVLVMTGVTALVRATAYKMDTLGITYPGKDIRDILIDADLTHISNEVSFAPDCPPGDPATNSLRFCSDPDYIGLLEDVGTDIVELTGNHMNDWGTEAMAYSLDLYKEHNLKVFAGGLNLEESRKPLIIEHNGNKLGFIGCNPPGPVYVWATETQPGAAPCGDYEWMHAAIQQMKAEGILPIATFQYYEAYDSVPVPWQVTDFRGMADAGAVIVSGSQAHYPQAMEFSADTFIHYGLGNLFFDQQNFIDSNTGELVVGTRWEFADQHVFYDGKYLNTELLTFMLEDWAKPRVMTPDERRDLLTVIFSASGW